MTSNPGGRWSKQAVIKVFVKNTSNEVLWWALDHDVWQVVLSGAGAPKLVPWPGSQPPPLQKGPRRLEPGAQDQMKFNIDEAGTYSVWPPVSEGKYTVVVKYSPNELLKMGTRTGIGEVPWTHSYDVPGFWKGTMATPAATVEVKHP